MGQDWQRHADTSRDSRHQGPNV
ncbi:hypothetical protein RA210_U10581 [Rubrivivax sp. A210]|nr:hypothetical protein RA210_U10581 [Rubrivivax sp. A210]